VCQCKPNYFTNTSGSCESCGTKCDDCGATGCATCKSGFYPSNGTCSACTNTNCSTCPGDKCTACKGNDMEVVAGATTCSCKPGTYNASAVASVLDCKPCVANCFTCSDDTTCDNCQQGYERAADKTCKTCSKGYFMDTGKNVCTQCDELCGECSKAGDCDKCMADATRTPIDANDLSKGYQCVCNSTFYKKVVKTTVGGSAEVVTNHVCSACSPGCKLCDGTTCQECVEGAIASGMTCACGTNAELINGACVCKPTFHKNSSNACVTCPSNCTTCDANGCSDCEPAYYVKDGVCTPCSDKHCTKCPADTCETCTGLHTEV
jgi:hypothetical protein